MPPLVRHVQLFATLAFLVAGFLVVLHVTNVPVAEAAKWGGSQIDFTSPRRPIPEITNAVGKWVQTDDVRHAWRERIWYPWLVAVFWLLAIAWSWRASPRARWQAGFVLALLTLAIIALEAAYLYHDYYPFLPGAAGTVEGCAVFALVVLILLFRRRADRRIDAVEATVASQALLGVAHLATLPSTMARPWISNSTVGEVADVIFQIYRPPFWIGCGALLLASVPVYLSRRRAAVPASAS